MIFDRLLRWSDRRMFAKLAAEQERKAAQCRARSLEPANQWGHVLGSPEFWAEEVGRYLDKANEYRAKGKAS